MRSAVAVGPDRHVAFLAAVSRALIALAAVALLTTFSMLPVAAKDRPPGGVLSNPVVRAIDLASPAVVRIATLYDAHLTLSACGAKITLPASGGYTVGGLGSGAFVSANGDILTADHVVNIDRQSLDDEIFGSQRASADVAAFLNAACRPSVPVTANDVVNGIVQFNGFPFRTSYSSPRILVWRSTSYLGAFNGGSASAAASLLTGLLKAPYTEASILSTSSFTEDDIALIHVALTDTPSIQLGSSSQLAVEDTLAVIGFPGNGDVNGDPTNLLTPSVNNVNVSALKRNDNGSQLIQVGGNVEHGDSGGPALDGDGNIVGIVSFGGADMQGITAFLRSSDNAIALLQKANIDTAPGAFQTLWQSAFAAYADTAPGHWGAAAREMDALNARYADFHGLDPYRAYADNAAIREAAEPHGLSLPELPLPLPVVAAIGAGFLALLVSLIVIALRRRTRKRARARTAPAPLSPWPNAGFPQGQGYPGAVVASPYASPYAPMPYNVQAQPTRPANGYPQSAPYPPQPYPEVAQPVPAQPYAGYAPYGSAPQSDGVGQSHPVSGPTPAGAVSYDGRPIAQSGPWQDGNAGNAGNAGAVDNTSVLCVNGHQMQTGAARCMVCGAERAQPSASAPREVSAPPWTQPW